MPRKKPSIHLIIHSNDGREEQSKIFATKPILVEFGNAGIVYAKFNHYELRKVMENDDVNALPLQLDPNANVIDGFTLIHLAAEFNSLNIAKRFIQDGVNLTDSNNPKGITPLHIAAKAGSYEVAELIIKNLRQKTDIDLRDVDGNTALSSVWKVESLEMLMLFHANGADLNAVDHKKYGVLHRVLFAKDAKASFDYLIKIEEVDVNIISEVGCYIGEKEVGGATPLYFAIQDKNLPAVKKLLKRGADVTLRASLNQNALQTAIASKTTNEIFRLIIDQFERRELDINLHDEFGYTVLDTLTTFFDAEKLEILLEKKLDIYKTCDKSFKISKGKTAVYHISSIHTAIIKNSYPFIEYVFKQKKVSIDILMKMQPSLLHACSYNLNCQENIIKIIIDEIKNANLSVDQKDSYGYTPFENAILIPIKGNNKQNMFLVNLLLASGADINAKKNTNRSLLYTSFLYDQLDIAEYLLSKGAQFEDESINGFMISFLIYISLEKTEIFQRKKKLVQEYAPHIEINPKRINKLSQTLLHLWIERKIEKPFGKLLQMIDVNAQDADGDTALIYALSKGDLKHSVELIKANSDVTLQNNRQKNALHYAISAGLYVAIKLILDLDTQVPYQSDDENKTPLDLIETIQDPLLAEQIKKLVHDYLLENIAMDLDSIILIKELQEIGKATRLTLSGLEEGTVAYQFNLQGEFQIKFFSAFKLEIINHNMKSNVFLDINKSIIKFKFLTKKNRTVIKEFFRSIVIDTLRKPQVFSNHDDSLNHNQILKEQDAAKNLAEKMVKTTSNIKHPRKKNKSHIKIKSTLGQSDNANFVATRQNTNANSVAMNSSSFFNKTSNSSIMINKDATDDASVLPYIEMANYLYQSLKNIIVNKKHDITLRVSAGVGFLTLFYVTKINLSLKIDSDRAHVPGELEVKHATNFRNWFRHLWPKFELNEVISFFEDFFDNPSIPLNQRDFYKNLEAQYQNVKLENLNIKLKDIQIDLGTYNTYKDQIMLKVNSFYTKLNNLTNELFEIDIVIALINEISNLCETFKKLSKEIKQTFSQEYLEIIRRCNHLHYLEGHQPELILVCSDNNRYKVNAEIYDELMKIVNELLVINIFHNIDDANNGKCLQFMTVTAI